MLRLTLKSKPMKKILFPLLAAIGLAAAPGARAVSMSISSLSGAVTTNDINSFITYMAAQTPPQTPWGALNGTNGDHNLWADGTGGRDMEAMGEMYEVSTNITILDQMISWADTCVSQRNDLMSAVDGGQRVMWTGLIDEVWCPNEPSNADAEYAGCENEDAEGHLAFCAKLILGQPSLWSTTVPDGDPFGYGATYYQRATNYLWRCDQANDEYSLKWFIQTGTDLIVAPTNAAWVAFNENVNANNRQMMFLSGFQRLAEAHEILGDNPGRVAQYDAIVKAVIDECLGGMTNYDKYTANGQTVYDWGYYPTNNAPESVEIHGEYDMLGVYRAYNRTNYGLTLTPLVPFANTMVDVIYLGTNTFAGNVDGSGGVQSPIYSGWLFTADWNPQVYPVVAGSCYTNGWYTSRPDIDAAILWMKNRRYLEFAVTPLADSESAQVGTGTAYLVAVAPLGGFTNTVNLTVSGLPAGATGTFNHAAVNLATINAATTNVTLTVTTSNTTPGGTYTLTITGTSGSVVHSATVTLVVTDFTIAATPASQTVVVDGGTNYTVNIGNINGFDGTVALSASGLPTGATAVFNPTSITMLGSSTLTVTTTNTTPAGNDTLTVQGACGSLIHSTTVTLAVTDFGIATAPATQTVTAGGAITYTNTISASNGFGATVTLSVSGLPAGASAVFSPASITGAGTSVLTVTTTNTMAASTNTLTVKGTCGKLVHSEAVTLVVNASTALPPGWSDLDIGAVGLPGSATYSYNGNVYTVTGSGADIYGTNDEFNFCVEMATNNFTITARVASLNSYNGWSKSGVMIRGINSSNSAYVGVYLTVSNGIDMQCRAVNGASAVDMARVAGAVAPYWVQLTVSNDTFTGYCSSNGTSWTKVSSTNVTMAASVRTGLAVCSHDNTRTNVSTFDNVSVGP